MQLSAFQDGFCAALRTDTPAPAWMDALSSQPGFAVYRNSGRKAALDALRANYPTVLQLVGEDWFFGAAQAYLAVQPPTDGRLMDYGAGFAAFLAGFAPAAELPYLSEVAQLDRAWTEAHLAADAPSLDASWMASQPPDALGAAHIAPHPAARWLWCNEHPAYSIWQRHREGLSVDAALPWQAEGALLTRPRGAVQWCALPRAGTVFLDACAAGRPLAEAAEAALAATPEGAPETLAQLMALLLASGALCTPAGAKETT
ncbi:MAG: putative DNA-binding domain-containing protein [Simplicispira suum]|uniref:HvfC/BufC N-terminal domain-containing protein n=1 Tax=Simplicispira suum TaxID=2109915 RepID=UPI001C6C8B31|nr:DNA-binding domain-containing protein [Simplicispira suum]MBW7832898.1 putative DNA-binding domain-containing protein [Simplicispira suum]